MKAKVGAEAVVEMHVHFQVCGTERGSRTEQAIAEPTPSHLKACNKHTNVQLARTVSISWI